MCKPGVQWSPQPRHEPAHVQADSPSGARGPHHIEGVSAALEAHWEASGLLQCDLVSTLEHIRNSISAPRHCVPSIPSYKYQAPVDMPKPPSFREGRTTPSGGYRPPRHMFMRPSYQVKGTLALSLLTLLLRALSFRRSTQRSDQGPGDFGVRAKPSRSTNVELARTTVVVGCGRPGQRAMTRTRQPAKIDDRHIQVSVPAKMSGKT